VAFEGLAVGTPGRGNEDSEERGERRRAFVMPKLASTGWSRSRWAADAGVGKNCVYEYLRGVRQPTSENRRALAEALAVRLEDLPE
jgi:ribosome-binding protein aMBF1 (putative translation factor)